MALGKRKRERQLEAFVAASDLPQSPGHSFYVALNRLLAENIHSRTSEPDTTTMGGQRSERKEGCLQRTTACQKANTVRRCREHAASWSNDRSLMSAIPGEPGALGFAGSKV